MVYCYTMSYYIMAADARADLRGPRAILKRELRGPQGQGMGVVSNTWFDRVLLSTLYMSEPSG